MAHDSLTPDSDIPRIDLDSERNLAEPIEQPADGAITAGMLVEYTADGVAPGGDDGVTPDMLLLAREARERGMETHDEYPDGVLVPLLRAKGGYVNLPLAAGEAVTERDDGLTPAGGGEFRAAGGEDEAVAVPIDSVDNSEGDDIAYVACEVFY